VTFSPRPDLTEKVAAHVLDVHEEGCGLDLTTELPVGGDVLLKGDFGHILNRRGVAPEIEIKARVSWCQIRSGGRFRAGVCFSEEIDWHGTRAQNGHKESETRKELLDETSPDYYEVLQLSPNADAETIHRVFRILAQRYHPDNQETGDAAFFRLMMEAYRVLSDAEARASYDAGHQANRRLRWRIFDHDKASQGPEMERLKRKSILTALYTKHMNLPQQPGLTLSELEELLGVPREHLEFPIWYLREQGQISRTDNGRFSLTVKGVDQAELPGEGLVRADHALPAPAANP